MRSLLVAVCALSLVSYTGCGRYSNTTPPATKEEMKENERVYGDVEGPAKQSLNKYEADPEAATQAAVVKAQLFGQTEPQAATTPAAAGAKVDTAAALKSAAE
jgi:hypothetical protein